MDDIGRVDIGDKDGWPAGGRSQTRKCSLVSVTDVLFILMRTK
jgi:hypothetical protein